jgi:hypothetical protein
MPRPDPLLQYTPLQDPSQFARPITNHQPKSQPRPIFAV